MQNIVVEIKNFLKERNWDKSRRVEDLAKSICIEAAELLEIFQWESLTIAQTKKDKERLKKIKEELADVFIYAFQLAIFLRIDVGAIIKDKIKHNAQKYPAHLVKKRTHAAKLQAYSEAKKRYRKQ